MCDEGEEEEIFTVHSVGVKSTAKPYKAELEIIGKKVAMEIDTGAAVSLISHKTQKTIFPNTPLSKPTLTLRTYTAEPIAVVGQMQVTVKYNEYVGTHELYVVSGDGLSLIGKISSPRYSLTGSVSKLFTTVHQL